MPRAVRRPLPLVVACLLVIAALGVLVRGENVVTRFDADVVGGIADDRGPVLVDIARAVTSLGDGLVLAILLLLAGAALTATRVLRPAAAFAPAVALGAGAALTPLAKAIVERPRPPAALHEVVERSSGFPSGHSAQSAAGWLALGLVLAYAARSRTPPPGDPGGDRPVGDGDRPVTTSSDPIDDERPPEDGDRTVTTSSDPIDNERPPEDGDRTVTTGRTPATVDGPAEDGDRPVGAGDGGATVPREAGTACGRWPLAAAAAIVVLVGVSRVVLSVHSPTDVVAGWLLGTACAVVVVSLLVRDGDPPDDADRIVGRSPRDGTR